MPQLSHLDRRLISALRRDGRASVTALAAELGVTRATVGKRMDALAAHGVIVGYSVRIRQEDDADAVRAVSLLAVERNTTDDVISVLAGFPEIQALHTTNGAWDLVADVVCGSLAEFDQVLGRIRGIRGVVNSETNLLLSSVLR